MALYDRDIAAITDLQEALERLQTAESALRGHGYRRSCDIPACNCGDQWNHGGHAAERLREIDEALPYYDGATILQRLQRVLAAADCGGTSWAAQRADERERERDLGEGS
jgi:hypothetical protein